MATTAFLELLGPSIVDLAEVREAETSDLETRLLECLAREPFRYELGVLDDAARKGPERLLTSSALQNQDDVVPTTDDPAATCLAARNG